MKIVVIGAGIFGITTAIKLSEEKHNVTIVDSNNEIMLNASKCNHNRIHFGFHYPRSKDTAIQSLIGYKSFYNLFKDSIIDNFKNYYMIEKSSKINSNDYYNFCKDLNLYIEEEYPLLNMDFSNIESSFITNEPIFDYKSIKVTLNKMLVNSNIKVILNKTIQNKSDLDGYDVIINTTYSNINKIKDLFNIDRLKLKLQLVTIPSFEFKSDKIGLTIMDGKYCSIMPNGFNENNFLLYHVDKSVIKETEDYIIPNDWLDYKISDIDIRNIYEESTKYFTFLNNSKSIDYYKTIRALPINNDDCRLSDIYVHNINNVKIISVLSGKISTCLDIAEKINKIIKE